MATLESDINKRWLLPDGIEEVLPEQAEKLERIRRDLIDMYAAWGYRLVITPMIEYLDSLLTGTGEDLELQTFKIIDHLTGRLMGIRADITPQAARIDSHIINTSNPVRLCYLGTVLRTHPDGLGGTRAPLQLGAELYGHAGVESDIEIIELMLETMKTLSLPDITLDLGHVGIYRGIAQLAGLDPEQENELFGALQQKAVPEINVMLKQWNVANKYHTLLSSLANLNGGVEILEQARAMMSGTNNSVKQALDELSTIAQTITQRRPEINLHFDLSELRGYQYQNGVVYAVYSKGFGRELARGGRYDGIGKVFGRDRPATGFSTDLKTLMRLSNSETPGMGKKKPIFAPFAEDESLQDMILALRSTGERVVSELPGQEGDAAAMGCDRMLVNIEGEWEIKPLQKKLL
jgi:ATP phosphoribosyltransferase regulatory subunit